MENISENIPKCGCGEALGLKKNGKYRKECDACRKKRLSEKMRSVGKSNKVDDQEMVQGITKLINAEVKEKLFDPVEKALDATVPEKLPVPEKPPEADLVFIVGPDGYPIYFFDNKEKRFYISRWESFKTDYDWTKSSDNGLLSRLLIIELEIHRLHKRMGLKPQRADLILITKLTEEYRRCQQDLGISRSKRISEKEEESAGTVMARLIDKYKEYISEHKDEFLWKCSHCGQFTALNTSKTVLSSTEKHVRDVVTMTPEEKLQAAINTEVKEEVPLNGDDNAQRETAPQ